MRFLFLLRVHHWPKNAFLFIPAFFAGVMTDFNVIFILAEGFVCFSLVASAVYIINDYRDRKSDRLHPTKKNRPIASGKISEPVALGILALLLIVAIPAGFYLSVWFGYSLVTYLLLNVFYSLGLKNIAIVDTLIVSSGFLIRTVAGGWLANVEISQWLVIMVFLLSFFLTMGKRRDDLVLFEEENVPLRASSRKYTLDFINTILSLLSGVIIVSYIMYTVSDEVVTRLHTHYLYLTSIFVFAGLMRFLQIAMVEKKSGSPTKIFLTDRFIQVTIAAWGLCFFVIIYVSKG